MRMRVVRITGILLVCGFAPVPSAGAATFPVDVRDDFFSPRTVTINPGDTVQWSQGTGIRPHNVKFDDGSFERPADPSPTAWTEARTFSTPGRFEYYCRQHGGPNGAGMSGVVVVAAGGGGGGGGTSPTGDKEAPGISKLDARQSGRSISVTITADEAGKATVIVQRSVRSSRLRQVAKLTRSVKAGTTKLSIARTSRKRRLAPALYRVTATVKDRAGNVSSKRTDRVRLRSLRRR